MYKRNLFTETYFCNYERLEQLNERLYNRNLASTNIPTTVDPRPQHTRRGVQYGQTNLKHKPIQYFTSTHFLPSNSKYPYIGYAKSIDAEHHLRNQFFPKQKECVYTSYIPSTKSSLYNQYNVDVNHDIQKHSLLFKEPEMSLHNPSHIEETRVFFNDTRQLVKNQ